MSAPDAKDTGCSERSTLTPVNASASDWGPVLAFLPDPGGPFVEDVGMVITGPSPRSSLSALAARTLAAIPPPGLVLLGIVSVQLGSALAKNLFPAVGSFGTVALRLFFAAAVLMLLWRPSPRLDRRTWAVVLTYGVILGLMNLSFYLALARIPLGIAVTIDFLGPLAVALLGSRRWLDGFWAVLAGAGVVLLTEGGGSVDPLGFLFAVAAATFWGLYIVVGAALGRIPPRATGWPSEWPSRHWLRCRSVSPTAERRSFNPGSWLQGSVWRCCRR
jgi:hypothetical protein